MEKEERAHFMIVYLSEYIYPEAVKTLKEHATVVDNFDHIEEIDAIILRNISVTAEMMENIEKTKGHRQTRHRLQHHRRKSR